MAGAGGETAALGAEEREREGESAARTRRNQETRDEILQLKKLEKVKHSLDTISKRLERTQFQKMSRGPLRRVLRKRSMRRREDQRQRNQRQPPNKQEKKKRNSWVVGHLGMEGVKDRRKSDEEELKDLQSMGVVKKRLSERERVREQAVKFFKHRYKLDRESTQKSDCILVTGYEEGRESVTELIRQQSTFVIENFFNQPTPSRAAFSRRASSQRRNVEGVATGTSRLHHHSSSDPYFVLSGQRGSVGDSESIDRDVMLDEGVSDGHVIPKATPTSHTHTRTRAISAPVALLSKTTPLAPPSPPQAVTLSTKFEASGVISADSSCEIFDSAHPETTPPLQLSPLATPLLKQATPTDTIAAVPSPPPFRRSTSYIAAMETDDMVSEVAEVTPQVESERVKIASQDQKERVKITPQEQKEKEKEKSRKKTKTMFGLKLGNKYSQKSARAVPVYNSNDSTVKGASSDVLVNGAEGLKTLDVTMEEEDDDVFSKPAGRKVSLSVPSPPQTTLNPSPTTLNPSPTAHPRLSPQFSIASLPGRDATPGKYYTSMSPRIDKVTGTYSADTNPFAQEFDRALQTNPEPHHAPSVARSNTTLPDDIINDEGFQEFLRLQDAKPSTSLYIAYQIMNISQQIDCKYGKHINQALDDIIHDVITQNLTWENFSAVARQLMFKEGLKDGLFMVPAFGRRLLGILPGMRDVITSYTQAVFDEYAMEWLLMRGGWGELLRQYDSGEREVRKERGEEGLDSEEVWFWCCDGDDVMAEEEREEEFDTAMGYGLITPAPEKQNRSLGTVGMDIADLGHIVEQEVSCHDDRPHPPFISDLRMGSELFLAPVHEIAPRIGRGLRRVISVEVLFSVPEENGCHDTADVVAMQRSLTRVSSLPSMSSSIPSPSPPISIPSHHKYRLSTDRSTPSSGMGMSLSSSPHVFTLPSMREAVARPHPSPSPASSVPSSEYRRQSSALSMDSSIRIVTGSSALSPPPTASSPIARRRSETSQLAKHQWSRESSGLLSMTTSGCGQSMLSEGGCGQLQATPTHEVSNDDNRFQETSSLLETTHPTNEEGFPPVERSATNSSEGYPDFGLESENGSMTEWEWDRWLLVPTAVLVVLGVFTFYMFRRSRSL